MGQGNNMLFRGELLSDAAVDVVYLALTSEEL